PSKPPTATISFLRHFFTRAPSPASMSATKTKVQGIIDENPVAVFSKSYCPYCRAAKQLLSDSGAKFYAIELDQVDDGSAIQESLADITGQRTVPNIFIGREHIGGNSELQGKKGKLPTLLKEAGAV
ncbi:glutaredoxin, partial [Lophiostoma macrostomum CBS 122681]